jgi:hypothetical protein
LATKLPRVNVTLTLEQYALLSRLAEYQERSRSAVLVELLETVMPVFERVVVMAEAAGRANLQAIEGFRRSMERAQGDIEPLISRAIAQYDWVTGIGGKPIADDPGKGPVTLAKVVANDRRASPSSRGRQSSSPRPVTRGPGRGARAGLKAAKKGGLRVVKGGKR